MRALRSFRLAFTLTLLLLTLQFHQAVADPRIIVMANEQTCRYKEVSMTRLGRQYGDILNRHWKT